MTEEEIIDLADDAGSFSMIQYGVTSAKIEWLQKFADLVAAREREACAQVCEDMRPSQPEFDQRYWQGCTDSAAAIRSRREK